MVLCRLLDSGRQWGLRPAPALRLRRRRQQAQWLAFGHHPPNRSRLLLQRLVLRLLFICQSLCTSLRRKGRSLCARHVEGASCALTGVSVCLVVVIFL